MTDDPHDMVTLYAVRGEEWQREPTQKVEKMTWQERLFWRGVGLGGLVLIIWVVVSLIR